MVFMHRFKVDLEWSSKESNSLDKIGRTIKNHIVKIDGKEILNISAAKSFKGDATLYNPEDLLLSSLASCHMMSYLYCCSTHKIEILSYTDHAEALLEVSDDGAGRIVQVLLHPVVVIADPSQIDLALSLHTKANELCFIANSCNFPVVHQASCSAP